MFKLAIFWGAYTCFPLLILFAAGVARGGWRTRAVAAALFAATGVVAYARFIEPQLLVTHRETIILPGASASSPAIRIALFGDPHIGLFGNAMPIDRIVRRINAENVDGAFLAGDLTYHPDPDDIGHAFSALEELDAPLFVVFGNHDVGFPGDDLTGPLMTALGSAGAQIVHNRAIETDLGGRRVIVAGASDLWQRRQDFSFSQALTGGLTILLLTHNPDTARVVPDDFAYDLMLAGHTHGGQIRLPFLYQRIIPTEWPFDKELHHFPAPGGDRLVYVTSGTGMVGLPMRFLMPPRVDILTLHLPE